MIPSPKSKVKRKDGLVRNDVGNGGKTKKHWEVVVFLGPLCLLSLALIPRWLKNKYIFAYKNPFHLFLSYKSDHTCAMPFHHSHFYEISANFYKYILDF